MLRHAIFIASVIPTIYAALAFSKYQMNETFMWGAATSAFQVEGCSTLTCGRGPSVWDSFENKAGKIKDGSTATISTDSYHNYGEDVELLSKIGFNAYRFSISWSRIFPNGTGTINEQGVLFYDRLINSLLSRNITPFVTLFHWDMPLSLELKYESWLNAQIVEDFTSYADFCFSHFGDRVKRWITINEVFLFDILIYPDIDRYS